MAAKIYRKRYWGWIEDNSTGRKLILWSDDFSTPGARDKEMARQVKAAKARGYPYVKTYKAARNA